MRILIVNKAPPYPRGVGGTEVIIGEVFSRLVGCGHSCWLVCGTLGSEPYPEQEVIRGINVHYMRTYFPWMGQGKWAFFLTRYFFFPFNRRMLMDIAGKYAVDVIYEFVSPMPSWAPYVAKQLGIPCVARVWEYWGKRWHDNRDWLTASIGQMVERFIPKLPYSQFITSSRDQQKLLVQQGHYPIDKMRFIPQGIDLSKYRVAEASNSTSITILQVGRFTKQKGQIYLVRAVPHILQQIPSARFVFVGSGPTLGQCQEEAATLDIQDKVEFKGRVSDDELLKLYESVSILVVPSLQECIPLVAWEAMACGVPVVLSDGPGVSEFARHDFDAVIVQAANVDSLAQGIIHLLMDSALYNRIQRNALETVRQYDWDRIIPLEEQMLTEVISSSQQS